MIDAPSEQSSKAKVYNTVRNWTPLYTLTLQLPSRSALRWLSHRFAMRTYEDRYVVCAFSQPAQSRLASMKPSDSDDARLDRLADALTANPEERARLFHLAGPGLEQAQPRDDSIAVLEAFSHVRSLTKRLLAATSAEDILTTAGEHIADWFEGALVHAARRRESGLWECHAVDDEHEWNEASKVIRDVEDLLAPESRAALNLYPRLPNAGDVGTPALWPLPIQQHVLNTCDRRRFPGFAWIYARVRSRTGFIGGFSVAREFGNSYSASDRAVLTALAEFTSFALSDQLGTISRHSGLS
jgi:hypothetical protein